jgi:hypothetical protein
MKSGLRSQGAAGRVLVALDPSVGIEAALFAAAWSEDGEAQGVGGGAIVVPAPGGVFLPGVAELVVIPLAVNLGSSALYDMVRRLLASSGGPADAGTGDLEVAETLTVEGERLLVVRLRAGAW